MFCLIPTLTVVARAAAKAVVGMQVPRVCAMVDLREGIFPEKNIHMSGATQPKQENKFA